MTSFIVYILFAPRRRWQCISIDIIVERNKRVTIDRRVSDVFPYARLFM